MLRKILRLALSLVLSVIGLSILLVIVLRFVPIPLTPLMVIRSWEQTDARKPITVQKKWVGLDYISPNLQQAVVASEDQNFYFHNGFDLESINKAIESNKHSQNKRGASTISQQVAKNVFLWPGRTWVRKALETYFTVLIEFFWPKQRILEVYLNVAEMGDGIYGAEAAARSYYHKAAEDLNPHEAALLAAALPNPRHWNPAHPNLYMRIRSRFILFSMHRLFRNGVPQEGTLASPADSLLNKTLEKGHKLLKLQKPKKRIKADTTVDQAPRTEGFDEADTTQ